MYKREDLEGKLKWSIGNLYYIVKFMVPIVYYLFLLTHKSSF